MSRRHRRPLWESLTRPAPERDAPPPARASAEHSGAQDDVASPCTGVCSLRADGICPGCFRSIAEITGWIDFSCEQRRAVLAATAARRAAT